jgi:phage terminase small subunit
VIDVALSVKQEKFCLEYAKLGNARQAYINAGYKHKKNSTTDVNACRLLKNDKVKARLAELAEEAKDESIADIKEMQQVLTSIIRQEMTEEVIVLNSIKGTFDKTSKKPALKEVISAIEKLGKMQGAFKEKMELEVAIPVFAGEDDLEE